MDLTAAALAASQIAGLRQQQIQSETFVSLISQAAGLGKSEGPRAPTPVPAEQKGDQAPNQGSPDRRLPRGSLVNILA
jgi:hypothetical protein